MNWKNKLQMSWSKGVPHMVIAFAFLLSIVVTNQVNSVFGTLFYYATALIACYLGVFSDGKKMAISQKIVIFGVLIVVTGVLNILFVGNSTVNKQLFTLCSIGIALLFLKREMNPNVFLVALLVNAAVVLVRLAIYGLEGPLYISSSSNFVSVHVLLPAGLYYSAREAQGRKLILWPAVLTWVMCLLARGRGGILFSTFFLGSLMLYAFVRLMLRSSKKARLIWCCSVAAILVVLVVLAVAFDVINRFDMLSRFAKDGLGDNGRFPIWGQYFDAAFSGFKSFFLAPDLTTLPRVVQHGGNLHNSFMNIHAYNGILMVAAVIAMIVAVVWFGVKRRRVIYLICFVTLCLRGATDYVFWGSTGTPFFLYFLLAPFVEEFARGPVLEICLDKLFLAAKGKLCKGKPKE